MMSRAMFALLLASVFYGGAATGFGHVLRVRVPETFAYFTGVIQGGIATEAMGYGAQCDSRDEYRVAFLL